MKNILELDNSQTTHDLIALLSRLTIGIVLFPHGAQKLLGWWNGYGYDGTMHYFTHIVGIPYEVGFLVIMIEFFGPILLVLGLWTRVAAAAIMVVMIGVIISVQHQYFFMDWFRNQQGEGMEFFFLMIGLCLVSILNGGGKFAATKLLKL
jgi:putative oxidoreductase